MTFVRSAYAFGLRMAPDQAVHLTRTKDTSLVAQTKRIEHLYQKHRIALAFSEYLHAETLKFPTEVVEADSARFGSGYECGKRIHSGRMLVLKGRQSKQWSSQPLPVKVSKGKRGMGPETVQEVSGPIQKQTPASALLGVDGGKAWKKAAEGRIVLRGVSHQTKIFTPASKVSKQKLPAKTKKFLENNPMVNGKEPECTRGTSASRGATIVLKVFSGILPISCERQTAEVDTPSLRCGLYRLKAARHCYAVQGFSMCCLRMQNTRKLCSLVAWESVPTRPTTSTNVGGFILKRIRKPRSDNYKPVQGGK